MGGIRIKIKYKAHVRWKKQQGEDEWKLYLD